MGIWNVVFFAIIVFSIIVFLAWFFERMQWNDGICGNCNNPWVYFDTDSQGGRGYKCKNCGNVVWISWPFIDTMKVKNGQTDNRKE